MTKHVLAGTKRKILAHRASILNRNLHIKRLTTNPTLMRKAGIAGYAGFARCILREVPDRPVSFEAFADEQPEIERGNSAGRKD